jgi:ABC transporter substrate binding protein
MESRPPIPRQGRWELKRIAPSLSIELSFVGVRTPEQFDKASSDITRDGAQALYVVEDPIFFAHRMALLNLASMARLPTIHELVRWPEAGALISYGPDLQDLFRRAALYVGRILNGAQPADLPVEQPTKFELVINLKTAKLLGLEIPPTLLALTDVVIEWDAASSSRYSAARRRGLVCMATDLSRKAQWQANSELYASEIRVSLSSDRGLVDTQSLPLAQTH